MNKLAYVAAAALSVATLGAAAIAQDAAGNSHDFDVVDANKDMSVSWDEAVAVFPTLTQDLFNQVDTNADGVLDESEYTALLGLTAGLDDANANSSESSSETSSEASSSESSSETSSESSSAQ